jgi:hypothetical protein
MRIANTGPSGVTMLLVSSAVIGWGMYQVGQGNIYRRYAVSSRISFCHDGGDLAVAHCALLNCKVVRELQCTFHGFVDVNFELCLRDLCQ